MANRPFWLKRGFKMTNWGDDNDNGGGGYRTLIIMVLVIVLVLAILYANTGK